MEWNRVLSHWFKCRFSKLMWIQRSMYSSSDASVSRMAMHWDSSVLTRLGLIHHCSHVILLLMALALGQSICFSDSWQAAECWMEVYSTATPAALHAALLFIYWSSYLPIIWRLSHLTTLCGIGQMTGLMKLFERWMLLSTALTLQIAVRGDTFTHTCRWPWRTLSANAAVGVNMKIKPWVFILAVVLRWSSSIVCDKKQQQ